VERSGRGPSATFIDFAWTTMLIGFALWIALAVWYGREMRGHHTQQGPRKPRRWWLTIPLYAAIVSLAIVAIRAGHFQPRAQPQTAATATSEIADGTRKKNPNGHDAAFRWEELIAVLAGLGIVGAVVLARRRGRLDALPSLRLRRAAAGVSDVLDEAVDDLRGEPDVRRAIIAAYARTERVLALHGLPRRRSEAPLEYLERALTQLDASGESIRRLTDLFEWAKFSHHEPDPRMKDEAIDALLAVRDELSAPAARDLAATAG
jgi:hypothetical protein